VGQGALVGVDLGRLGLLRLGLLGLLLLAI